MKLNREHRGIGGKLNINDVLPAFFEIESPCWENIEGVNCDLLVTNQILVEKVLVTRASAKVG